MLAWHLLSEDKRLGYGDGRLVEVGQTLECKGKPVLCDNGMHGSVRLIDAVYYASGPIVCRVKIEGDVIESEDKLCGRRRTVLWMLDATRILHEFACRCAEDALALVEQPDARSVEAIAAKRKWLRGEITDEELDSASAAARAAAWAARAAARDAAWAAACAAAEAASWDASWAVARGAASAAFPAVPCPPARPACRPGRRAPAGGRPGRPARRAPPPGRARWRRQRLRRLRRSGSVAPQSSCRHSDPIVADDRLLIVTKYNDLRYNPAPIVTNRANREKPHEQDGKFQPS